MIVKVKMVAHYEVLAEDEGSALHYIESVMPSPSENKPLITMRAKVSIEKNKEL